MDYLVGITGKDFVLVASDCMQARSIVVMKSNMDKMMALNPHTLMLTSGPVGDSVNFGEFIQKNLRFQALKNGFEASTAASAHYVRNQLSRFLRSRTPYQVNLLVAGYDEEEGPQLYYLDYLGSMVKVPFGAHGYGGFFTSSTMDRYYERDMDLEQAKDVLRKCINEVQGRFLMNLANFKVRMVNAEGIHDIEL
eukprot:m.11886 g.11886  ORF g.11886 m.11886 type:complete len:194 (-) comp3186_c0_seq1:229-810(-)